MDLIPAAVVTVISLCVAALFSIRITAKMPSHGRVAEVTLRLVLSMAAISLFILAVITFSNALPADWM